MAIMGRKKKAVAAGWDAINKQREVENKLAKGEDKKESISKEEHEARLKLLKDLGLVK